jgi:hypothetical protein
MVDIPGYAPAGGVVDLHSIIIDSGEREIRPQTLEFPRHRVHHGKQHDEPHGAQHFWELDNGEILYIACLADLKPTEQLVRDLNESQRSMAIRDRLASTCGNRWLN